MVNGSFVFGMDQDDESVFAQTVDWAVGQGIETATFHVLTPYPGTGLYARMAKADRLLHSNWDLYDTRHVVFKPARLSPDALVDGYWRAYRDFYTWSNILRGASTKASWLDGLRHAAYAGGWKKFEPLWDWVIRAKQVRPQKQAGSTACATPPMPAAGRNSSRSGIGSFAPSG
jgi:radical SAM superfamily enzyme YgiQ (UPF0313 family)